MILIDKNTDTVPTSERIVLGLAIVIDAVLYFPLLIVGYRPIFEYQASIWSLRRQVARTNARRKINREV